MEKTEKLSLKFLFPLFGMIEHFNLGDNALFLIVYLPHEVRRSLWMFFMHKELAMHIFRVIITPFIRYDQNIPGGPKKSLWSSL